MGMPSTIHGMFSGTLEAFQSSLSSEPYLIITALAAVYIVLGILYESLIHPITILSTLPSAGVGAILALLLFRTELSIIAMIGIILLIGIVKKNAIMMIDFALAAERTEGKKPADAIYEACILRFRPILMTTMAAMFGALPLALGTGTGSELRRPLGITIIGGLLLSQVLTLYTTPVVYLFMNWVRDWLLGCGFALAWSQARRTHGATGVPRMSSRNVKLKSKVSLALLLAGLLALNGCDLAPKYHTPAAPTPPAYKELTPADQKLTDGWRVAEPKDDALHGQWWTIFQDSQLNGLEDKVNISNQTIAEAFSNYMAARALVREARSQYFPTVTTAPAHHRRASGHYGHGFQHVQRQDVHELFPAV